MPTKLSAAEVSAPLPDLETCHHAMILEGMADVDAGRFVSQAGMEAWVEGLDPGPAKPLSR